MIGTPADWQRLIRETISRRFCTQAPQWMHKFERAQVVGKIVPRIVH